MADDLATTLVKQRESYRSRPYWDVNHWRVGYGSDTTTDANGNVHAVTRDTVTTRADANRDLARRIPAFQQHAAALIGQDAWNALPEGSRAALTSVAYNYGSLSHLPSIVSAARSGNPQAISHAILARANDNGGVNAQRRQQEAGVVLGHPIPLGTIPDQGIAAAGNVAHGTNFAVAGAPLPKPPLLAPPPLPRARPDPAALKPSSIYQQMPQDASYGIQQRLVPGQKTAVPTDFQALMPLGRPDARALSLTQPFSAPFVSEDHPKSNAVSLPPVNKTPSLPPMSVPNPAGIRSIEINPNGTPKVPGSIQTSSPLAGNVQMGVPRPPSIPVPPSSLHLLGKPANSSGSPDDRGTTVPAMPSRPPVLAAPVAPQQAAPPPIPQQSAPIMPQAPQRAPMVTLASGKQIAPGVYNQGDHNVQVSDDGTSHAKIDIVRGPMAIPGLIDPMKEAGAPTLAGALIRNQVPQAMAQGYAGIKNNIGSTLQGFGSSIGGAFGGLFGQPAPHPWAPAGQFVFPQMQRPPVMAPRPMQRPLSLFSIAPGVASMAPVQQQSAVGAQFLNTQGINTQGLTIGQQANELNKALAGSSRNSDGSRGFGVA